MPTTLFFNLGARKTSDLKEFFSYHQRVLITRQAIITIINGGFHPNGDETEGGEEAGGSEDSSPF